MWPSTQAEPQWGPAVGAGIRTRRVSPPSRCSCLNGVRPGRPESGRHGGVGPERDSRASMGSGRGGRNQGSGKTEPVSREDTGSCESCQQVGMLRASVGREKAVRWPLTCLRALPGYRALYRTARTPSHDLRAGCRLAPRAPEGAYRSGRMEWPEVDLDDAVLMKVHHLRYGGLQLGQLGEREVAQEHRILQAFSMILHQGADPPQPLGIGDVVGHQVPATGHGLTA